MRVKFDSSAMGQATWHQYGARFLFGGCITAVAGLIATRYGPEIGGLLLAFPAIFPAAATLIEKHEKEKKEKEGLHGTVRARQAASIDAAGAAIGSIGLIVFAFLAWQLLPKLRAPAAIAAATAAWLAASVVLWEARKNCHKRNRITLKTRAGNGDRP
jgi:uncharacterized membrane protein (GlpM family)